MKFHIIEFSADKGEIKEQIYHVPSQNNIRQKLDWEEHQESDKNKNAFKCFFSFFFLIKRNVDQINSKNYGYLNIEFKVPES